MQPHSLSRLAPLLASRHVSIRPPRLTRSMGRVPGGAEANNPNENPADDLGGPGGQELYPISMALHRYVVTPVQSTLPKVLSIGCLSEL